MAATDAAADIDDDYACCGGDDHLSGSQLRCAQLRPLGIPMGLQGSPRSPPEMCSETLNEVLYLVCEMLRLLRQSQMPAWRYKKEVSPNTPNKRSKQDVQLKGATERIK